MTDKESEKLLEIQLNKKLGFVLDENNKVIPASILDWSEFIKNPSNKILQQDNVNGKFVSTVFVGLDQGMLDDDNHMVFETMVFESENDYHDLYTKRYSTWDKAMIGH